jgi:hypothetical protein
MGDCLRKNWSESKQAQTHFTYVNLLTRREKAGIHRRYPPFAFIALLWLMCLVLGSLVGCKLRPVEAIGRGGIPEEVALVEHKF